MYLNNPFVRPLKVFGAALCRNKTECSKTIKLDNLNVLYFNARSLNNKLTELQALLALEKYDAIFVTETWFKSWHKDSFLCSDFNYFVLRADRHDVERGGGVCVFIKLCFASKINLIESFSINKEFDVLTFDWYLRKDCVKRFVCAYLPPDSAKDFDIVTKMVSKLDIMITFNQTYVFGDFNFNHVVWKNGCAFPTVSTKEFSLFYDFMSKNNMTQLVTKGTHVSGHTLDLVLAPVNNNITKLTVNEPLTNSCDHLKINIVLDIQHCSSNAKLVKKNFYNADYEQINRFLRNIDWDSVLNQDNIDMNYDRFISVLHESIDRFVPDKIYSRKTKIPKYLKSIILKKKRLYRLSKSNIAAKTEYQKAEKLYKKLARKHRDEQAQRVLSSGNSKLFFGFMNKRLKSKSFIPPLLKPSDMSVVTDRLEKADLLNSCFSESFQPDDDDIDHTVLPDSSCIRGMPAINITFEDIECAIRSLKSNVSGTPEEIPALFVKMTCASLLAPLKIIFNQTLSQGEVPLFWKKAIVVPLHKKGLRSLPCNYRPVSLTSVFCRLLEKIICRSITEHFKINHLNFPSQHGFIERRSTLTNQLLMMDVITNNYDLNIQTDMILLDFSKAFDVVPHKKLVTLLRSFQIQDNIVTWIKNLLSSRTQQTLVDGKLSTSLKVLSGVPQGSVIGPLLFSIYLYNLLQKLRQIEHVHTFAFADDLKILSSNQSKLEEALKIVESWCDIFKLKLNPSKSEHLSFKTKHQHIFKIYSDDVKQVEDTKDLGIIINNKLKWELHIRKIKSKAISMSWMILRTFRCQSLKPYISAYKTFVRPLLEYNSPVWNSCNMSDLKSLEQVQKMFTRILLQRQNIRYDGYAERLKILNLENLELRRLHFDLIFTFKIINNLVDLSIDQFFIPVATTYNLRQHKFALKLPNTPKTNIMIKSFKYRVIKCWNSLPENVVTADTLNIFKTRLALVPLSKFLKMDF